MTTIIRHRVATLTCTVALAATIGCADLQAQDSTKTIVPILNYTADLVANTCGGIKAGVAYQGYAEAGLEINPWKNGKFNFTIASTHGGEPSTNLVGDWQVFDNLEAGNHIFALNAWYSHDIGKFNILVGLQDANDSYSTCDASGNLINTSFGGNQVLLSGGYVPTMPCNGLGLNLTWKASDVFSWQAGIFDGGVIDLDDGNRFNLKHKLSRSKGYAIITEGQFTPTDALVLKAGAYYHTGLENNGYYASLENLFPLQGKRSINTFITGGSAPCANDAVRASITCGATLNSLFSKSGADALSAGLSTIHFDHFKWETAVELNYRYQLNDHFYASPDVQWILNPMVGENAKNALVAMLRIGFEL